MATSSAASSAAPSVAHQWNEVVLNAIRKDRVRPPVQARNLFHISAAIYDAWAAYQNTAKPYLLGNSIAGFNCPLPQGIAATDSLAAQQEALSFAAFRLILHRYSRSPNFALTKTAADNLLAQLGYDAAQTSLDTSSGSPAALGNYIADCYIRFGLQDGANEANNYANQSYSPSNPMFSPFISGDPGMTDMDRWQPLALETFIDQGGNPVLGGAAEFVNPEWGSVVPFAMTDTDLTSYQRDNFSYPVYFDPGAPPSIYGANASDYQWTFALVAKWSSHLDPNDGVMMDISPASIGNIQNLPQTLTEQRQFYQATLGGDTSRGYSINPISGQAYTPQLVPRGDYTRVLAEFWADGPNSETPPGHWFTIFNSVSAHPLMVKRIAGKGELLSDLEWDVKGYFALGGAMHDAAVAAWGVKGWYDTVRPVSAIRAMAALGQSSAPNLPHYHERGLPLEPGYIELIQADDPLVGANNENLHKLKLRSWRGPNAISDPAVDTAGVEWILAESWMPYQRPSFVSPPFGGYVSGHSTFSRAAAEVLSTLTGSAFFPGGMSGFEIKKNAFLVFEEGPSVDMTLEWATYRDAANQCSLSRIWGGIHPPVDDMPGRLMGEKIGIQATTKALSYF